MALNMLCPPSCLIFMTFLLTGSSLPTPQIKKQEERLNSEPIVIREAVTEVTLG